MFYVFGGTGKRDDEHALHHKILKQTDYILLNCLTSAPAVICNGWYWVKHTVNPNKTVVRSVDDAQKVKDALTGFVKAVKSVNWGVAPNSSITVTGTPSNTLGNNSSEGMTSDASLKFSKTAAAIAVAYHKQWAWYDRYFVLAHGRGCLLAINALSGLPAEAVRKLKRIVLLDPVAMNRYAPNLDDQAVQTLHQFVEQHPKVEIHLILPSKATLAGLSTFADKLVGIHKRQTFDQRTKFDLTNWYVHVATMSHYRMLEGEFQSAFGQYKEIVSADAWTTLCFGMKTITLSKLKESSALQAYHNNKTTIDALTVESGDPLYPYWSQLEIADRRRAFVHALTCKIWP